MPWPTSLVVKNGSNARAATSGGMPGAGVGDLDDDRVAVGAGADRQRALAVHGVDGVVDEVGPDLVELAGVGVDLRAGRAYSRTTVTPRRSLWPSIVSVLSRPSRTSMRWRDARSIWE